MSQACDIQDLWSPFPASCGVRNLLDGKGSSNISHRNLASAKNQKCHWLLSRIWSYIDSYWTRYFSWLPHSHLKQRYHNFWFVRRLQWRLPRTHIRSPKNFAQNERFSVFPRSRKQCLRRWLVKRHADKRHNFFYSPMIRMSIHVFLSFNFRRSCYWFFSECPSCLLSKNTDFILIECWFQLAIIILGARQLQCRWFALSCCLFWIDPWTSSFSLLHGHFSEESPILGSKCRLRGSVWTNSQPPSAKLSEILSLSPPISSEDSQLATFLCISFCFRSRSCSTAQKLHLKPAKSVDSWHWWHFCFHLDQRTEWRYQSPPQYLILPRGRGWKIRECPEISNLGWIRGSLWPSGRRSEYHESYFQFKEEEDDLALSFGVIRL